MDVIYSVDFRGTFHGFQVSRIPKQNQRHGNYTFSGVTTSRTTEVHWVDGKISVLFYLSAPVRKTEAGILLTFFKIDLSWKK